MMMVYTAANVPYASLLGVITTDSDDRTLLATWRFIGGYLGGLFVTGLANSFFEYFKKSIHLKLPFNFQLQFLL